MGFFGVLLRKAGLLVGAEVVALIMRSGGFEVGLGGEVVKLNGALTGGVGHVVLSFAIETLDAGFAEDGFGRGLSVRLSCAARIGMGCVFSWTRFSYGLRNPLVLVAVVLLQTIGLAVQVQRAAGPAGDHGSMARRFRRLRYWSTLLA